MTIKLPSSTVPRIAIFALLTAACSGRSPGAIPAPMVPPDQPAPIDAGAAEPSDSGVDPQPAVSPEPGLAPPESPPPFADQETVTLSELLIALEEIAVTMEDSPNVRADFAALRKKHGLPDDPALYRDYVRVKLIFECTRDGGFWYVTWKVTGRLPQSDKIWKQWAKRAVPELDGAPTVTAWAECDELSALFAFLARKMGVDRIGLYWPGGKHTVAVWLVKRDDGVTVPVVVPTSQIYLDPTQSLGTKSFKVGKKRKIHTYKREDVDDDHALSVELARFFVEQARRYAQLPQEELQQLRNARSIQLDGS